MAIPVILPKQGQSVESCIITEWYKQKGDTVSQGEILFAYETDKASFEEECPVDGVLLDVFYETGDEVPVLTNVAVIGSEGENFDDLIPGISSDKKEGPGHTEQPENEIKTTIPTESIEAETLFNSSENISISPRAKKLARNKRINIKGIVGSGPKGRIIEQDIVKAAREKPRLSALATQLADSEKLVPGTKAGGPGGTYLQSDLIVPSAIVENEYEQKPLSNMRKIIAKAMHNSLQSSAQLTHHLSADARKMLTLRKKSKKLVEQGSGPDITLNDFVCFAVVKALKNYPDANVHFMGDSIRYFKKIHLGLAVDTERGLMVPAIKNAGDMSLVELSSQLKEVATACKKGNIDPDLLSSEAATFTVSNLGNYGVEMFTPVLNLPQACILGVNTIIQRPAPLEDGSFGFVPFIGLSLTYDHRALDGGPATRLLADIKKEIENLDMELI